MRFSLAIQDSATDTIGPILEAYNARTKSGYVEGVECCVEKLQALGGTFSYLMPVDLFNDESVQLTRQLKDLQDLSTIWTDYTQDFQIPASETNNAIFSDWFDENLVLGAWNPNLGKNAVIYINSLPVYYGRIELIGCKFKNGLPQLYNLVFYGTTKKLLDTWGQKLLNSIPWTQYEHVASYSNIMSSWDQTLLGGDILWPIADYNQGWRYSQMKGVNGNINYQRGVEVDDLRPTIRLRAMLTNVFLNAGYVLSGSFLTRPEMDDLYVLPMQTAGPLYDPAYNLPGTFQSDNPSPVFNSYTNGVLSYKKIICANVTSNPSGNYNAVTGDYTANRKGNYTFVVYLNNVQRTPSTATNPNLEVAFFVNGRKTFGPQNGMFTLSIPLSKVLTFNKNLNVGDVVSVQYAAYCPGGSWSASNITYDCTIAPQGINGNTIDMADAMPKVQIKDFVNGVLKTFNCILIPTGDTTIEIHNLNDWYALGTTKNWTQYMDITDIEHDKLPIPRTISMKHKENGMLASDYYRMINTRDYGSIEFNPLIDYPTDTFELESIFCVIVPQQMDEVNANGQKVKTTDLQIPVFMDQDSNSLQIDLTLFYYGGKTTVTSKYYFNNIQQTELPLMTSYSAFPTTNATYSLAFGLETTISGDAPTATLWDMYWSDYLSRMYSTQSRLVKMNGIIPVGEWLTLKLNDTIAISGNYYKLQSLQYDMLTERASLELITYPDVQIMRFSTTGQKSDFTDVTANANGQTYIRDYVVANGIMNAYTYGGQDYLDTNQDIVFNKNNVFSLVQEVNNIQAIIQFNQITMYRDSLSGPSATDSTTWANIPMEHAESIGYVDNITYSLSPSKYICTDGGQYKFTAMVEVEQSGNKHSTFAILINGIPTTGYGALAVDYGTVNFSTILDLSPTDEVTLAWKPKTGGTHTVYFNSANFLILKK